jgi:hypothetical protein
VAASDDVAPAVARPVLRQSYGEYGSVEESLREEAAQGRRRSVGVNEDKLPPRPYLYLGRERSWAAVELSTSGAVAAAQCHVEACRGAVVRITVPQRALCQ